MGLLEMRGITKRFPGVLADDHVDFTLERGEVHALLGENGAGKTTLMNMLYGLYRPDEGEIVWRGKPVSFKSPHDAIAHSIGMVHQNFQLIPTLTVAENVVLGHRSPREPFHDAPAAHASIRELSTRYGLPLDPTAPVWQLDAGTQQRVEIIKALYREVELLILDEPTSVLTPQETGELFRMLRRLASEGRSVIFITHKLDEVMQLSDRITVLRSGRVVGTVRTADTNQDQLVRMMIGRELGCLEHRDRPQEEEILRLEGVCATNDKGLQALKAVSLSLHGGEILGIAGIAGNGQSELAEVITGLRPVESGRKSISGRDVTHSTPREITERGVAYVPEDARHDAIFLDFSIEHNAALKSQRTLPLARRGVLDLGQIREHAIRLMQTFDVRAPNSSVLARQLSGGNLQKLVLGRELSRGPATDYRCPADRRPRRQRNQRHPPAVAYGTRPRPGDSVDLGRSRRDPVPVRSCGRHVPGRDCRRNGDPRGRHRPTWPADGRRSAGENGTDQVKVSQSNAGDD